MRGLIHSLLSRDRIISDEAIESPPAMEPVVIARGGRPRRDVPGRRGRRPIRAAGGILGLLLLAAVLGHRRAGRRPRRLPSRRRRLRADDPPRRASSERESRSASARPKPRSDSPVAVAARSSLPPRPTAAGRGRPASRRRLPAAPRQAKRFRVRDEVGRMRGGPPPRPVRRQDGAALPGRPARIPEQARPDRRAVRARSRPRSCENGWKRARSRATRC